MTPRELAESDQPLALAWVTAALAAMEDMDASVTQAALAVSFAWADLSWIRRPFYRARIRESLESIHEVLAASQRFFAGVSDEDAAKLFGGEAAIPPAYAIHHDRVYFTSRFRPWDAATKAGFGPNCRTAMLVHEAVHVFDPRSGEPEIHLSEWDPGFDAMPPNLRVHNPSAYASFAAQVYAKVTEWPREVRFGAGRPDA